MWFNLKTNAKLIIEENPISYFITRFGNSKNLNFTFKGKKFDLPLFIEFPPDENELKLNIMKELLMNLERDKTDSTVQQNRNWKTINVQE